MLYVVVVDTWGRPDSDDPPAAVPSPGSPPASLAAMTSPRLLSMEILRAEQRCSGSRATCRSMASTEVDIYEDEEERHFKQIYKILIIGDSNVGKTALLTRFVEGRFQSVFMSTVGIDYKTKGIALEDENIKLQIWDTAGQERFRTLTNAYFRGAAGAVLLYDITSRTTFNNILGWMDSIREHGSPNIKIALVGHKTDLEDERQVSKEEGRKLAENYDCLFFEASSKAGKNCGKIFTLLAQEIKNAKDESCYVRQNNSTPLTDDSRLALPETPLQTGRKSICCS